MPRRDLETLPINKTFYVYDRQEQKGYSLFSVEQLQENIENGNIPPFTPEGRYRVYLKRTNSGLGGGRGDES